MNEPDLEVVDGLTLSEEHRALLRPGEPVADENGKIHHLPRFFYSVPSWAAAREIRCAPHFKLAELMSVDCREAPLLLDKFPHYVPCAVALLAGYLEAFRRAADATVFVSVNGGYRSPAHQLNNGLKSMHCWGTAADLYRVGDTYLDDERSIASLCGDRGEPQAGRFSCGLMRKETITSGSILDLSRSRREDAAKARVSRMKDALGNRRTRRHLDLRRPPPRPVIGIEAEFTLFIDDVQRRPEKIFGTPRGLIRKRMIPRTGRSYQLPAGGAIYFDTGVIEVATPIVELGPGCCYRATRLLWEQIRYVRRELDAWSRRHKRRARLQGFSTHYNFSFPARAEIERRARVRNWPTFSRTFFRCRWRCWRRIGKAPRWGCDHAVRVLKLPPISRRIRL